ncbi:MAG: glycosyltransferase family 4 protein [Pseudolabrys sp.]
MMRLAVVASHPIQYQAPLFRLLATKLDLIVYFAHQTTPQQQADAGFGVPFNWDVDVVSGFNGQFLENVSRNPGTGHFLGCDTPAIGGRLREFCPDTVLVLGWNLKAFWQAVYAAKRIGVPVMVRGDSQLDTPRSWMKQTLKSLLYPAILRIFDAALYVGLRNKSYLEHYNYPRERLFFSPHCVDSERFAREATPEAGAALRAKLGMNRETPAALFAGKLQPFKRPLDVVGAVARMRTQGSPLELIVAGDGEMRTQLVASAKDAGVPLHFLGFRNQSEMPAVYAAANCLALPSDGRETWGLVVNEAIACGLPVVVSAACGCAADVVTNGVGRSFPLGDIQALSRSIDDILIHPPSAELMHTFSQKYGLQAAADGIIAAVGALQAERAGHSSCAF